MRFRVLASLGLLATAAYGATLVPPENLGEFARGCQLVVLARCERTQTLPRGPLLFTYASFTSLEVVKGPMPGGSQFTVETPGGEFGGQGWAVAGSPRFTPGQVYLLFLNASPRGTWQPPALAYGLLRRVLGRDGSHLLEPLPEVAGLESFPRPDGVLPEIPETYRELSLLPHLREVIQGTRSWDSNQVRAYEYQLPLKVNAMALPSQCTNIRSSAPYVRWPYNTPSPPGLVSMYAQQPGDTSMPNPADAYQAVADALAMWMGVANTSYNLGYGGDKAYTLPCTGGQDNPPAGEHIVVFNDPCSDISGSGCVGTLAFGGPWYSLTTHTFDGAPWYTIISWFVVVNDGVGGCFSPTNYRLMLAHELGHGLGFGHYSDPLALMYYACCHPINATDTLCAQYTYPASTPTPTPTPTATPTPTPTPGPTPTPTPTPSPTPTPTPSPTPTPTPSPTPTPTPSPTPGPTPPPTPTPTPSPTATPTPTSIPAPVADFTFTPAAPFAGDTVQFTNTSSGLFSSSSWNFGDGTTSSQTHPSHAYATAGTYTVTLTVTGPGGSSQKQKPVTVRQPQQPLVVPVIARVSGIDTPWRSDVVVANPGDTSLALTAQYRRSGSGTVVSRSIALGPRQALLWEDAVASLFGQGDGRGSLVLVPPREGPAPSVFSRTFSLEDGKRLGQGIPAAEALPAGTYVLTGLFEDSQFRTNLGVTAGESGITAQLELHRGTQGKVAGPVTRSIGPYDQQQWRLPELFPNFAQEGVPMTVVVTLSGPGTPWASVVDQRSHDAVYLQASTPAGVLHVPVVASVQGVVFWDTDLTLANLTSQATTVSLEFLPENRNNQGGGSVTRTVTLSARSTVVIQRLFASLLGVTNTKGSLSLVSAQPVAAACRIYTPVAGAGSYGQGVPVLPMAGFSSQRKVLAGVRTRDGFRTNVGFATPSQGVHATARLYDASGAVLAQRSDLYVPPRSLQQFRFEDLFPAAPNPNPVGTLEVIPNGPLVVYLSVVDGSSQDPVLVLAP